MTELDQVKKLVSEYAACFSLVGFDIREKKKEELFALLDKVVRKPEESS